MKDHDLKRWAAWVLSPVGGVNLGYGKSVIAKIMEGKGQILPGAPRCSGAMKIEVDHLAMRVDRWVASLPKPERQLLKLYYLDGRYTVEDKAMQLGISRKTLYNRVTRLAAKLADHLYPD